MLKPRTFRGGIHPESNKHFTEGRSIENMPAPAHVVIPLQQHIGAQCEPIVQIGEEVQAGQKIGDSKSPVSSPVHASISGKVIAIEPRPHPVSPCDVMSIVIERSEITMHDELYTMHEIDWASLTAQQIKEKIREAGIVGMGGAAFPTHIKLSPPPEKKIDTVILNGVECEPYLTADHRLMLENPAEILLGLNIILKVLGIKRAFVAIEENKPDAIEVMQKTLSGGDYLDGAKIEIAPLKVKYPQGAEKQLIKAITNREVPSGGLPFDVGVLVQNIGTAFAIYQAVALGKPLIERVLTVSGDGIKEPKNLRVRIGTLFSDVLQYCGGLRENISKIIMGGPMMGIAQYTTEVPVIKGTSGILVLQAASDEKEGPCIKCGRCVDICPMGLMPNRIADYAELDNFEAAKEYGVLDCMECGACAHVCASHRPVVHLVKYVKSQLAKQPKK